MDHDPDLERFENEAPHPTPHVCPADGWPEFNRRLNKAFDDMRYKGRPVFPVSLPLGPDGKDGVLVR